MAMARGVMAMAAKLMAMICVQDRLRARAFYGEVLGPLLGLGPAQVDDFGDQFACVAALAAGGVAMIIYPGMGQDADGLWVAPDGGARIGWFNDSEGNLLSIAEQH
jgi:hypothetical protein